MADRRWLDSAMKKRVSENPVGGWPNAPGTMAYGFSQWLTQ